MSNRALSAAVVMLAVVIIALWIARVEWDVPLWPIVVLQCIHFPMAWIAAGRRAKPPTEIRPE